MYRATMTAVLMCLSALANAEIYSYTNSDGDYIVSQKKPKDREISYAVLTDDGEFIRMVEGRKQVPITHWRPFFLPKEPHPYDGPQDIELREREPDVRIDEIEQEDP